MNGQPQCLQKDMFAAPSAGFIPLVLEIRGIIVPPGRDAKNQNPEVPNCHIPSKKNSKMLITKTPHGKLLEKPFLITKPEYQEWTEKAVQHLELQLLSACATGSGEIQQVRSKQFAILSRLPADDSVNDLTEGSWKVELVKPGDEGALIEITRLS